MKTEEDYMQDLREIRAIMERSTKFLSLSGLSGILAGIYALVGVYYAYDIFPHQVALVVESPSLEEVWDLLLIGIVVLLLAVSTAILLPVTKAKKKGARLWNTPARRMVVNMAVPLVVGGLLILILFSKGLILLGIPMSMIFYGLALYNASKFTFQEVKYLGFIHLVLGLISSWFIEYSLIFWAFGFGIMHIGYGIYMHYKYER